MKNIYELELHEWRDTNNALSILRVPGGWIYYANGHPCFVPLNTEFMPREEIEETPKAGDGDTVY